MKHIVSFSGGKDSTALLIMMLEKNMQIDEIRYFDCGSWEFPQMRNHIDKVEKYIKRPILRLKYKYTFDYLFSEIVKIRGKNKGKKGYRFPTIKCRWCTRIKIQTLTKDIDKQNTIQYIGYTVNELQRMKKNLQRKIKTEYPLIVWGMSEKDCLDYCYSKGFDWEGLYNYFDRLSCFCCPFQGLRELRNLRKYFPDLWERLLEMQKKVSPYAFRMGLKTVFDLEKRFAFEDSQLRLKL